MEKYCYCFYNEAIVCYNQKRKQIRETKFFRTRSELYAIAYTPCFVSLYNVAKGEHISRMQGTRVCDKICIEEPQDCASSGARLVNSDWSFPIFWNSSWSKQVYMHET
ncbi:hypothetical protein HRI_000705700 [Hibiscus trionum]|uniref:Uncharacterized protein n=1 Tax=Hibiscus trionum TaxID=183268 RepID=A0A9W7H3G0_HIBTR|nr:hypothetical protein HRI_000705700 [Hibiscus trionum]